MKTVKAKFIGVQEAPPPLASVALFNLLEPLDDRAVGSTLTRETINKLGADVEQSAVDDMLNALHPPKVRSLILYGSPTKLSNAHKLVTVPPQPPHGAKRQPDYFVRVDTFNGSMDAALDAAKPMPGETVLNTVEVLP